MHVERKEKTPRHIFSCYLTPYRSNLVYQQLLHLRVTNLNKSSIRTNLVRFYRLQSWPVVLCNCFHPTDRHESFQDHYDRRDRFVSDNRLVLSVPAELDDGAYNPLWTMRGFTQTFHFWKETRRAQSVPLNAFLTYITLPWWSIAKGEIKTRNARSRINCSRLFSRFLSDILDHREGPILTF